jgi:S1-C subfamily serine protease
MLRTAISLSILLASSPLVMAADVDIKQPPPRVVSHEPKAPADLPPGISIKLTNFRSAINDGEVFGKLGIGWFCPETPLRYGKATTELVQRDLSRAFNDRAGALGFSVPTASGSAFDQNAGDSAEYRIGATLIEFNLQGCVSGNEIEGAAYAKVKWEVYSSRHQKVVWSTLSEGSYAANVKIQAIDFNKRLWVSVIDNAFSAAGFFDALRGGAAIVGEAALPAMSFTSGQTVSGTTIKEGGAKFLQAVVTVMSGPGTGSGFYIGQEGLILTNQHVVGDAKFVKVKLFDGRSVVGEVVRVDKGRDVALVRTDPVSNPALALRVDEPGVGEEVYALGSPYGEVLSGTLTRGVLSSRRVLEGVSYLQSDAAVNPGNSGGPLVDANGRVVGLTVMGLKGAQGVNMFVPIGEALSKLSLTPKAGG